MEEIFKKLISLRTISDDFAANHDALDYIARFLEARGMYVRRLARTPKAYEALVASTRPDNAKTPTVLLAAHIDVMPASDGMFTLRKESGKYYGRGVYDMKFAIAAYLQVVEELRSNLDDYNFAILLTSDEEIGGRDGINGTRELVADGYRPHMVILPDGGQDWQLETASNGYMHATLEAHGKTGHSSRPWLAENASAKLVDTLHELKIHFKDQGPETDTLNIAAMSTSDVPANQVPDYAKADISIRLRRPHALEHFRRLVQDVGAKHGVAVTERAGWDVIFNSLDNPFVRRFADITEDITGIKVTGFHSYAGSDARFFAEAGIPYANGYPYGGGHHSEQEWLAEESLEQFKEIVRRYLEQTAHTR